MIGGNLLFETKARENTNENKENTKILNKNKSSKIVSKRIILIIEFRVNTRLYIRHRERKFSLVLMRVRSDVLHISGTDKRLNPNGNLKLKF